VYTFVHFPTFTEEFTLLLFIIYYIQNIQSMCVYNIYVCDKEERKTMLGLHV